MEYTELKIFLLLKQQCTIKNVGYMLGKFISSAMAKDKELEELHSKNTFKNYSYDYLYPHNKDGMFDSGSIYNFRLRVTDNVLANKINKVLLNHSTDFAKVLTVENKKYTQRPIKNIKTLTPVIITLEKEGDKGINMGSLTNIQDLVIGNLVNKYNKYFSKDIKNEDAMGMFRTFKTSKPVFTYYKGIQLIGVKVEADIATDQLSQDLIFFAKSVGLGEKCSSVGVGFVHGVIETTRGKR